MGPLQEAGWGRELRMIELIEVEFKPPIRPTSAAGQVCLPGIILPHPLSAQAPPL